MGSYQLEDPGAHPQSRSRTGIATLHVRLAPKIVGNFTPCAASVLPRRWGPGAYRTLPGLRHCPSSSSLIRSVGPASSRPPYSWGANGSSLPSARGVDDTPPPARWVLRPDLSGTGGGFCPDQGVTSHRVHRSGGVAGWLGPLSSLFSFDAIPLPDANPQTCVCPGFW